jgi:uncharacterized membrane protein YcaP (DUF421 family)
MMEESLVVIVRAVISFFTLLIFTRLLGKQQMGNLTYFDYINGITIGSIAASLATDLSSTAWVHWLGLSVYVLIVLAMQYTDIKNRFISRVVNSKPVVVIQNTKLLENNLQKAKLTKDEILMLLRQKNIFDLTQVEYAILEPNGNLSVLPKAEYQSVTPRDMGIPVQPAEITTELIIDGVLLEQNLKQRKKDMNWLNEQLHKHEVQDIKEVSFAAILPNEELYVDTFTDHISKKADLSDYKGPF